VSDTLSGVAVVGSANLDLVVEVARPPRVGETLLGRSGGRFAGGKGLNQAVASARAGAATRFCAAVGRDEAADLLRVALQDACVEAHLRVAAGVPTGVAHVLALDDGDNSIVVAAGANAELAPDDAVDGVSGAAVVLAQLEVPFDTVAAALRAARAQGALALLNAAPADAVALELLGDVDVLIVNETECETLGGVERLLAAGASAVVRTLGGDGVELHRRAVPVVHVPAFRIDPVDTTGAGDAFCGALAAALAAGEEPVAALLTASAAGAITASYRGANTAELSPAAIADLVAAR
jgi:ribokinase